VTPGLGLQFLMISMFATLRGTGIVKPTMIIQFITVGLNILFAAILTIGWLTGKPYGRLAPARHHVCDSHRRDPERLLLPQTREVRVVPSRADQAERGGVEALFTIGLPIGLEFFFMSLVMGVMYWVIRKFGADAQAGLAEGQGSLRLILLPAMAVAFAAAPIAGQNFGARQFDRVRETFKWTVESASRSCWCSPCSASSHLIC